MTSETQIHTIARQMLERHGPSAIAQAARNALACESKGDADEAREFLDGRRCGSGAQRPGYSVVSFRAFLPPSHFARPNMA
jgi:hypothetical protein